MHDVMRCFNLAGENYTRMLLKIKFIFLFLLTNEMPTLNTFIGISTHTKALL